MTKTLSGGKRHKSVQDGQTAYISKMNMCYIYGGSTRQLAHNVPKILYQLHDVVTEWHTLCVKAKYGH